MSQLQVPAIIVGHLRIKQVPMDFPLHMSNREHGYVYT